MWQPIATRGDGIGLEDTMKRWWGIRHVRWLYLDFRVHRWAWMCGQVGLGVGRPNESDLRALDAIWRGER